MSTPSFACGLYGLDHHLDNGTFEWAPFEPATEDKSGSENERAARPAFAPKASTIDPALMTPKTTADPSGPGQTRFDKNPRPVFARTTQTISLKARLNVQSKRADRESTK